MTLLNHNKVNTALTETILIAVKLSDYMIYCFTSHHPAARARARVLHVILYRSHKTDYFKNN